MLELRNVKKTYRTKSGVVNALDRVSLSFPSTGLVFISGKSGCGKTTLLNVIGGLDRIDGGEIYIQDKNFSTFSASEYDSYRNTLVGFVFQEYNLLAEYTVEYNIKIAMELQGVPVDEVTFEKLLKDMEIESLRNRKPSELSGGQRQRVAIARALVKQPRIIMADEPTGALDSATGMQVLDILKKLSEEKLVIVVSHDGEFAEKYADRIIRLVDGKVVEDITFTEKELVANVSEVENAVIVKEGADLSEQEKDVLAKAVKECKKIELTKRLSFRDKRATGEVATEELSPITLKKSKMKFRSAAYLGVKSLTVKPIRLVLTILISAFAFAVFGLFDTIANFNTQTCLSYQLKESGTSMVATADYIVDNNSNDQYSLKVSDKTLNSLSGKTGGVVKGIFNFQDNITGSVGYTHSIWELANSSPVIGRRYYTDSINGFIEFDEAKEINKNGVFKNFNYALSVGRYPKPLDQEMLNEGVYEVAISSYLADSIFYYLDGKNLNEKEVKNYKDLLDCTLSVQQTTYKIVGIINCGKIPAKYETIKSSTPYNAQLATLLDEYDSFINASAHKCFFVAKGFREKIKEKNNTADIFYAGSASRTISLGDTNTSRRLVEYVYNSGNYDANNILLFNRKYPTDGKVVLADNEVLVHCANVESLFSKEISALTDIKVKSEVQVLLCDLETETKEVARENFNKAIQLLDKTDVDFFPATINMRSDKTGKTSSHEVKIVGCYFNVDTNRYASSYQFKLMMNTALMDTLSIYSGQGDYSHILFSSQSVSKGTGVIVDYLTRNKGLTLTWYRNPALTLIQKNGPIIRQGADLFLYVSLALAVFSVFMLYNYISMSIANKRRSVGVLRGLGAGGRDVFRTFLWESLLIGLINGVLANGLCALGCLLVNSYIMETMNIPIAFALFGIRQALIILGVSLLTAIVSSALPIIKISKKKPVELIRRP